MQLSPPTAHTSRWLSARSAPFPEPPAPDCLRLSRSGPDVHSLSRPSIPPVLGHSTPASPAGPPRRGDPAEMTFVSGHTVIAGEGSVKCPRQAPCCSLAILDSRFTLVGAPSPKLGSRPPMWRSQLAPSCSPWCQAGGIQEPSRSGGPYRPPRPGVKAGRPYPWLRFDVARLPELDAHVQEEHTRVESGAEAWQEPGERWSQSTTGGRCGAVGVY